MSHHLRLEALRQPVESAQYTSNDYLEFCHARQLRPSVGRTGVCWDNAVAESFWESLKRECIQGRTFATRAEARRAIFRWINWSRHCEVAHQPRGDPTRRVGTAVPSSVITTRPADGEMPRVDVARNGGAPGVDGVTIADIEEQGVQGVRAFLGTLASELKDG
ncbi:MAG: integrase core domain-containing protein, partial [Haloechinothrix sp.]